MHPVNPFPAVAVFLVVTISVKPWWAQSHSSVVPVEVASSAAVEHGEWLIGTGRWHADHLVGSVSCNIAARVPGNHPPERKHLWPYVHSEGLGGQSNVCTVAGVHTYTHTHTSALMTQGDPFSRFTDRCSITDKHTSTRTKFHHLLIVVMDVTNMLYNAINSFITSDILLQVL